MARRGVGAEHHAAHRGLQAIGPPHQIMAGSGAIGKRHIHPIRILHKGGDGDAKAHGGPRFQRGGAQNRVQPQA